MHKGDLNNGLVRNSDHVDLFSFHMHLISRTRRSEFMSWIPDIFGHYSVHDLTTIQICLPIRSWSDFQTYLSSMQVVAMTWIPDQCTFIRILLFKLKILRQFFVSWQHLSTFLQHSKILNGQNAQFFFTINFNSNINVMSYNITLNKSCSNTLGHLISFGYTKLTF